jgi:nucleoside permease NupC
MGACQSVSSIPSSVGREYVLMGSPTKTVLAAATTIAIGAVVVTPLRDIQVEVSK